MADERIVVRVGTPNGPAFQLRKGEEGISVFELNAVEPPLSETEIQQCFRSGSVTIRRSIEEIEAEGLLIVPIDGGEPLDTRLRAAHAEIRPAPGMSRAAFKQALRNLE